MSFFIYHSSKHCPHVEHSQRTKGTKNIKNLLAATFCCCSKPWQQPQEQEQNIVKRKCSNVSTITKTAEITMTTMVMMIKTQSTQPSTQPTTVISKDVAFLCSSARASSRVSFICFCVLCNVLESHLLNHSKKIRTTNHPESCFTSPLSGIRIACLLCTKQIKPSSASFYQWTRFRFSVTAAIIRIQSVPGLILYRVLYWLNSWAAEQTRKSCFAVLFVFCFPCITNQATNSRSKPTQKWWYSQVT